MPTGILMFFAVHLRVAIRAQTTKKTQLNWICFPQHSSSTPFLVRWNAIIVKVKPPVIPCLDDFPILRSPVRGSLRRGTARFGRAVAFFCRVGNLSWLRLGWEWRERIEYLGMSESHKCPRLTRWLVHSRLYDGFLKWGILPSHHRFTTKMV
jgi:hypothetical protein